MPTLLIPKADAEGVSGVCVLVGQGEPAPLFDL